MDMEKINPIKPLNSYKIGNFIISSFESREDSNIIEYYLMEESMAFVLFMFGIAKDVLKESGQSEEQVLLNNLKPKIEYYIKKFGGNTLKNPFDE